MSLNRQQVFDTGLNQIRAQNYARSFDSSKNSCMYRGPNGVKCLVGACIPDEDYQNVDIEGQSALRVLSKLPHLFASDVSEDFLMRLQGVHDHHVDARLAGDVGYWNGPLNPAVFEREMEDFAKANGLTYTPPKDPQ